MARSSIRVPAVSRWWCSSVDRYIDSIYRCEYTHGERRADIRWFPQARNPRPTRIPATPALVQWRRAQAHRLRAGPPGPPTGPANVARSPVSTSATPIRSCCGRPATSGIPPTSAARCARAATCATSRTSTATSCARRTAAASSHPSELERLDAANEEYTRYVVEVCPDCGWNFLTRRELHGGGQGGGRGRLDAATPGRTGTLRAVGATVPSAAGSRGCPGRWRTTRWPVPGLLSAQSARPMSSRARGRVPRS